MLGSVLRASAALATERCRNHHAGMKTLNLAATIALAAGLLATAADRPNIVLILSDDFGYGSTGATGADPKLIRTPALDRLAREGRRFTDANTTSSVCSPTRYSVMTGRYCWRTSLKSEVLGTFSPLHIETNRLTMASLLKKHGYTTAAVGKWHLGYGTADDSPKWRTDYTAELSPGALDVGFDYHFGVPSNHGDLTGVFVENRFVFGLRSGKIPEGMKLPGPAHDDDNYQATYGPEDMENARANILDLDAPRRKNKRVMDELTDKAISWMEKQPAGKPFFLYFTPVAVHNPVTPDDDLAGKSAAGPYGDWIHELDRSVGRVLESLDRKGVADKTLVLFSSDNGGVFKPTITNNLQHTAYLAGLKVNGALRGGKHDVWEGGFKVPFFVRWPGRVAAGSTCPLTISLADILATTAGIVGEPLPAASVGAEDSRSFLPALLGDAAATPREDIIVHSADGVFAIRKGPWKWIEGVPVDETKAGARKTRAEQYREQLYDTVADPAETKDVSAAHPEVVKELRALLNRYRNGGFSRTLPPVVDPPAPKVAVLPPAEGTVALEESFAAMPGKPWAVTHGEWAARDGGVWAVQKGKAEQGACLHGPVDLADGVIQYEICFRGADRHSLRMECDGRKRSFRIEVGRTYAGITKNPAAGEDKSKTEPLARKPLALEKGIWYPVRVTFKGNETVAQVNDTVLRATHDVLGTPKSGMNLLVFGDSAGFRNLKVIK